MNFKPKIGIVGFGHLGQYLAEHIKDSHELELAFIWNRTTERIKEQFAEFVLSDLEELQNNRIPVDVIVEVAHPEISKTYGSMFLNLADYMIGSPTALADPDVEQSLNDASSKSGAHGVYVPSGALWGGEDIRKMASLGSLKALTVTMKKHPDSLKLESPLKEKLVSVGQDPFLLYEGPVRGLCSLAPNNVNTMAAAAIAGTNLGLDKVIGRLIADRSLADRHIVEIETVGPHGFRVQTVRSSPAIIGEVTGLQTYAAFLASLKSIADRTFFLIGCEGAV